MRPSKWGRMANKLLVAAVATLALGLFSEKSFGQFVEEIGTLESLYESRARAVLNSFLRPHDYTVVVAADIDRDEERLAEYRQKLEVQFLPGLPIPADPQMMPAQNKLHSMKSKIEVSLVLAQDVPVEKEKLLKDILTSKLHLDEAGGDKITISRAVLPQDPQSPPQILPELSWKTWSLILLIALLALAGLIFWVSRSGRGAGTDDDEDVNEGEDFNERQPELGASGESDEDTETLSAEPSPEELHEAKQKVIALATKYPAIASRAIREMIDSGRELDAVTVMEAIGWDISKKLFTELGPRAWGKLGGSVRSRDAEASGAESVRALADCHRIVLARVLEKGAEKDEENPFSFLLKASPDERRRILSNETPVNLAIVSWHFADGELNDFYDRLDLGLQTEIMLAMARLDELPAEAIRITAQKLAESLQTLRQKPVYKAEGPRLAAQVLRSFAPEREMELIERLRKENPQEVERIRRVTVQFPDLALYPPEILSEALGPLDVETLTKALSSSDPQLVQTLLALIPKKKAMMVERDLESPVLVPSLVEIGASRRAIVEAVAAELAKKGLTVEAVWARIDASTRVTTGAA